MHDLGTVLKWVGGWRVEGGREGGRCGLCVCAFDFSISYDKRPIQVNETFLITLFRPIGSVVRLVSGFTNGHRILTLCLPNGEEVFSSHCHHSRQVVVCAPVSLPLQCISMVILVSPWGFTWFTCSFLLCVPLLFDTVCSSTLCPSALAYCVLLLYSTALCSTALCVSLLFNTVCSSTVFFTTVCSSALQHCVFLYSMFLSFPRMCLLLFTSALCLFC